MHSQRALRNMAVPLAVLHFIGLAFLYYFMAFVSLCKRFMGMGHPVRGKIVVVTGAAQGIGLAIAERFARQHCAVVLLDIKPEVEQTALDLKNKGFLASFYVVDVRNFVAMTECFNKIVQRLGRVDVVVCNAGVLVGKTVSELQEEEIRRTLEVNTLGVIWTVKACLPHLVKRGEGQIVATISISACNGTAYVSDYSASKYAVQGFLESLEDELRLDKATAKIVISMIFPTFVNTALVTNCPCVPRTRFSSGMVTQEQVADKVFSAVKFRRRLVFVPEELYIFCFIKSFLPWRLQRALQDVIGLHFVLKK